MITSSIRSLQIAVEHGRIETPAFFPDATRGFVRGLSSADVKQCGVQGIMVNTFHLYMRPGVSSIQKQGGLHAFIGWRGPIMSDSGGFQVFSFARQKGGDVDVTNEGVAFRSPYDGSRHFFSPEEVIRAQWELGVDMMVCLDECPPPEASRSEVERAVERTVAWARRSKEEYLALRERDGRSPLLFAVVQGGRFEDLRAQCAAALCEIGFDGYGFGGMPVDEEGSFSEGMVRFTASCLPSDSIRFGLGIGAPGHIAQSAAAGWDAFDCVVPTREARHGRLYVLKEGGYATFQITNASFRDDSRPIEEECACSTCVHYSRAFLHFAFRTGDALAGRLASIHNLAFYMRWMRLLREGVSLGKKMVH